MDLVSRQRTTSTDAVKQSLLELVQKLNFPPLCLFLILLIQTERERESREGGKWGNREREKREEKEKVRETNKN